MDYLREGIHLRGFAQIDPLVAYKNEGFTMFRELMNSIWEEFARVIFHVEVNIEPADFEPEPEASAQELSMRAAVPTSPPRLDEAAAGRDGPGRRSPAPPRARPPSAAGDGWRQRQPRARTRRRWSRPTARRSAATTPAGAARARSTRSATAPERNRHLGRARFRVRARQHPSVTGWPPDIDGPHGKVQPGGFRRGARGLLEPASLRGSGRDHPRHVLSGARERGRDHKHEPARQEASGVASGTAV